MPHVITKKKTNTSKIINREHWLTEAANKLAPLIEDITKKKTPQILISVGFPSRNALSNKRRTIGQCWDGLHSKGSTAHQIFIHPQLHKPINVVETVAHELIHAHFPSDGHRGHFPPTAHALGLEGKMTATVAGKEFIKTVDPIIEKLGPYPHAALVANGKYKSQSTRLIKCKCPGCGYMIRTTRKWLDAAGEPICPTDNIPMSEE